METSMRRLLIATMATATASISSPTVADGSKFDGSYVGSIRPAPNTTPCSRGADGVPLVIKSNEIAFTYNPRRQTLISGPVNFDGTFTAKGYQSGDEITMTGTIVNGRLEAETVGGSCRYVVDMTKR